MIVSRLQALFFLMMILSLMVATPYLAHATGWNVLYLINGNVLWILTIALLLSFKDGS
jgi:hypothetical protein